MTHDKPLTFFERPNLTSPYAYPARHRELDADGRPTNRLVESHRRSDLITPVPKAKKRKAAPGPAAQAELDLATGAEGLHPLHTAGKKLRPRAHHQRASRLVTT